MNRFRPQNFKHLLCLIVSAGFAFSSGRLAWAQQEIQPQSATQFQAGIRPLLEKYCAECHSPGEIKGLDFLTATVESDVAAMRGVYSSVVQQMENRTMPPSDSEQPTDEERRRIADWIKDTLRATACDQPPFAPVVMSRRLNRTEYKNTIRDLLGVDLDVSDTFPVDGSGGEGFDNNGETLFLPPMLMERYLESASVALDRAIVTPPRKLNFTLQDLVSVPSETDASKVSAVGFKFDTYVSANYDIIFRFADTPMKGLPKDVEIEIDGIVISKISIPSDKGSVLKKTIDQTVKFDRGTHIVRVILPDDSGVETFRPRMFDSIGVKQVKRSVAKERRTSHKRLLGYTPDQPHEFFESDASKTRRYAQKRIQHFARQAFRRPVDDEELEQLIAMYDRAAKRGDPFEECVKLAMKAAFLSPNFLFRIEAPPSDGTLTPIDAHALASRMSYFLWSTMPDEQLSQLADSGQLLKPEVISSQLDRMLADSRCEQLSEHFIGQWLGTGQVSRLVAPSVEEFEKEFSTALLVDIRQEPTQFFSYMIRKNASVIDFLDANYSVLNKRLVEHYKTKSGERFKRFGGNKGADKANNKGGKFEFTEIKDVRRRGLLGMSAVHLVTSRRDRTSPVLRGAWVLETMLGVRVPPPPPSVPAIEHDNKRSVKTLREKLQRHRDNPACAACHNLMDPIGFSLQNFDILGRWREKDGGKPIDATGRLPNGKTFEGPQGLRNVLLERKDEFVHHLTRKMLGYSLGRSLSDRDDCVIQQVVNAVKDDDYRVRTMIREIVLSVPFRNHQVGSPMESPVESSEKKARQ